MWVRVCSTFHVQAHHFHNPGKNQGVGEWGEHWLSYYSASFYLFCLHLCNPVVLSFFCYTLFLFFLLSFFPPITELGSGSLDQCHHSGWQRGRAQRFPGWLNGLCGCLSSFWVFSHWLSPHLSGELTKEKRKHTQDINMIQLFTTDNKMWPRSLANWW